MYIVFSIFLDINLNQQNYFQKSVLPSLNYNNITTNINTDMSLVFNEGTILLFLHRNLKRETIKVVVHS